MGDFGKYLCGMIDVNKRKAEKRNECTNKEAV
jgi:hypothetical protein